MTVDSLILSNDTWCINDMLQTQHKDLFELSTKSVSNSDVMIFEGKKMG